jgi:hypothetical protein
MKPASAGFFLRECLFLQANTYLDGLESRAQLLAENPDLGMARETLFEGLLSFPYESHILYYKKTRSRHRDFTSTPSAHGSGETSLIL